MARTIGQVVAGISDLVRDLESLNRSPEVDADSALEFLRNAASDLSGSLVVETMNSRDPRFALSENYESPKLTGGILGALRRLGPLLVEFDRLRESPSTFVGEHRSSEEENMDEAIEHLDKAAEILGRLVMLRIAFGYDVDGESLAGCNPADRSRVLSGLGNSVASTPAEPVLALATAQTGATPGNAPDAA